MTKIWAISWAAPPQNQTPIVPLFPASFPSLLHFIPQPPRKREPICFLLIRSHPAHEQVFNVFLVCMLFFKYFSTVLLLFF